MVWEGLINMDLSLIGPPSVLAGINDSEPGEIYEVAMLTRLCIPDVTD